MEIFYLLENKCMVCGETDQRMLQIHHKNRGGRAERRELAGERNYLQYYSHILKKIRKGSKDYQLLCANRHCLADRGCYI